MRSIERGGPRKRTHTSMKSSKLTDPTSSTSNNLKSGSAALASRS
eukprot:CAMPEP_0170324902 /NCGR_PEP_ID=MMETSP0116_2-20130129/63304_1 /TAXON_ID=400756 /ORGANISM="Durinskia baltica, Strain CSIRO CS-38" /LENGTH=44 /DNA_ID= /DNA_START= /DNA_END= /DNA_ORIENTATION=